jgi:hypothetical protein
LWNGAKGSPDHSCGRDADLPPVTSEETLRIGRIALFPIFIYK